VFENIRRDLYRACLTNQGGFSASGLLRELFNPGTQAILVYRFGHWSSRLGFAPLRYPLRVLHFLLQYIFGWRVGIFLHPRADIGAGFVIHTWGGGVFMPRSKIGRDVTVVGGGVLMDFETREIGDEVRLGAGTKVIGKLRIGHRVKTGPNSVIQTDIPDDCVAFGNPARILGPFPRRIPGSGDLRPAPDADASDTPPAKATAAT
jgi:serine O-acetyltransferase